MSLAQLDGVAAPAERLDNDPTCRITNHMRCVMPLLLQLDQDTFSFASIFPGSYCLQHPPT